MKNNFLERVLQIYQRYGRGEKYRSSIESSDRGVEHHNRAVKRLTYDRMQAFEYAGGNKGNQAFKKQKVKKEEVEEVKVTEIAQRWGMRYGDNHLFFGSMVDDEDALLDPAKFKLLRIDGIDPLIVKDHGKGYLMIETKMKLGEYTLVFERVDKNKGADADEDKADKNKGADEDKAAILLVGDSIIDNRAYTKEPTGMVLSGILDDMEVLDHAVEETQTIHFENDLRDIPFDWFEDAKRKGYYPYPDDGKVENFPSSPNYDIQHVVVSVGGNDVILGGIRPQIIGPRIVKVLRKYRDMYPRAKIFYVKPYELTDEMADGLAKRIRVAGPVSMIKNMLNTAINDAVNFIRQHGFDIILPQWQDGDIQINPSTNIPEPYIGGARRLAEAIARSVTG